MLGSAFQRIFGIGKRPEQQSPKFSVGLADNESGAAAGGDSNGKGANIKIQVGSKYKEKARLDASKAMRTKAVSEDDDEIEIDGAEKASADGSGASASASAAAGHAVPDSFTQDAQNSGPGNDDQERSTSEMSQAEGLTWGESGDEASSDQVRASDGEKSTKPDGVSSSGRPQVIGGWTSSSTTIACSAKGSGSAESAGASTHGVDGGGASAPKDLDEEKCTGEAMKVEDIE